MSNAKKNYIYQILYQMLSFLTTIVLTPYLSRVLGADGIGINSYVTANVNYFILFGNLGILGYGQREIAYYRDNKKKVSQIFWELEILHIIFFGIVLVFYGFLILYSEKYRIYYVINLLTIISSIIEVNWFFQAFERFDLICKRNIAIKIISLICVFVFVNEKRDLCIYIFIISLSLLLGNMVLWHNLKNYVCKIKVSELHIKKHIKNTLIFFLPSIAGSIYSLLDKSVINWITGSEEENGYYEQAYKLLMLINVVVQSFSTVLAPNMTYLYAKGKNNEIKDKLNKAIQFMLLISMGCAFGMSAIAERFVPIFFGEGYSPVIRLIYVFMPLVVVVGFSVYLDGLYLVPTGKRKQSAYAVCIGAISNLILNTILVYFYKALGAAIATLLTETIVTSIMFFLAKDAIKWNKVGKDLFRYCICGVVVLLSVRVTYYYIPNNILGLLIQICLGILIYLGLLVFTKDELVNELKVIIHNKMQHRY